MNKKSLILSSAGLRNLVPSTCKEENEFIFIFGENQIKMNNLYAEFISPPVSRLHYSDPSINNIHYDHIFNDPSSTFSFKYEEIFTNDIITLLHQISSGYKIEIDEEQSIKMRFISLLLGNNELFNILGELFPIKIRKSNFEKYIDQIQLFQYLSQTSQDFDYTYMINLISSHFYAIDPSQLFQLPKPILHSIISNKYLKLQSEDSLFEFIQQIFSKSSYEEREDSNYGIISFYEQIHFSELSEEQFFKFIQKLNATEITSEIWTKLQNCFYMDLYSVDSLRSDRYSYQEFEYDNDHKFNGIIHFLTDETGGNVSENGTVVVTSSSTFNDRHPWHIVDLEDDSRYFMSDDDRNAWVMLDFGPRKVHPTAYTIRSRPFPSGNHHLRNWCVEGSNSAAEGDWRVIDDREAVSGLDNLKAVMKFDVQEKIRKDEAFRYLRLRLTGVNTGGYYYLTLSAIEFFGFLIGD